MVKIWNKKENSKNYKKFMNKRSRKNMLRDKTNGKEKEYLHKLMTIINNCYVNRSIIMN